MFYQGSKPLNLADMFIMEFDVHSSEVQSHDCERLRFCLEQLIGEPFLNFKFSYGDELSLNFGQPCSSKSSKLKHFAQGSYVVSTRASKWQFIHSDVLSDFSVTRFALLPLIPTFIRRSSSPSTKRELEKSSIPKDGCHIKLVNTYISNSAFGLVLVFSDDSGFSIWPSSSNKQNTNGADEIADGKYSPLTIGMSR